MKLYATTTSDKHGREAKKGGDKELKIDITIGNWRAWHIEITEEVLTICKVREGRYVDGIAIPRISDNDNRTA